MGQVWRQIGHSLPGVHELQVRCLARAQILYGIQNATLHGLRDGGSLGFAQHLANAFGGPGLVALELRAKGGSHRGSHWAVWEHTAQVLEMVQLLEQVLAPIVLHGFGVYLGKTRVSSQNGASEKAVVSIGKKN